MHSRPQRKIVSHELKSVVENMQQQSLETLFELITSYDNSKRWLCSTTWTFMLEIGATTHGHSVVSRLLAILHDLPTQHARAREIWSRACIILTFLILNRISPFKNKTGIEKRVKNDDIIIFWNYLYMEKNIFLTGCRLSLPTIWLRKPRGHKSQSGQSGRVVANPSV